MITSGKPWSRVPPRRRAWNVMEPVDGDDRGVFQTSRDSRSSGRSRLVPQADCRCLSAHSSNGHVLGTTGRRAGSKSALAASPAGQSVAGLRALRGATTEDPLSHHGQGQDRADARACGFAPEPDNSKTDVGRNRLILSQSNESW